MRELSFFHLRKETMALLFGFLVQSLLVGANGQECARTSGSLPSFSPNSFPTSGLIDKADGFLNLNVQPDGFGVDLGATRTNCPFDEIGLVLWDTLGIEADGNDVTLPSNTKILVQGCMFVSSEANPYGIITIPDTSELIFADDDISVHAFGFRVEGKMKLGSETCRLHSKINITLHGTRPNAVGDVSTAYKAIQVSGGELEVFGSLFYPTWTRLAAPANAGATELFLQNSVNWRQGAKIVLTGTEVKDARDWHRNEEAIISSVRVNRGFSRITLTAPLQFHHFASADYQGEVGLLSHNIKIEGYEGSSPPTDTSNAICSDSQFSGFTCQNKYLTGYGAHVIIMTGGSGKASGVELFRVGQTNFLGRYPWHFHNLNEEGSGSYFKDSSVHESYFRCVVIHGTNKTQVENNVAFDAIGHCYYLEDGVEERNTLKWNLASHIHVIGGAPPWGGAQFINDVLQSQNLINPADTTASGFYISNAYNRIVGNVASGGYSGFSFPALPTPIGDHKDEAFEPWKRPTLEFDSNQAHSSGFYWSLAGIFYIGGQLELQSGSEELKYDPGRQVSGRDTRCDDASQCDMEFFNTKVFLSGNLGFNMWGRRSRIENFAGYDTGRPIGVLGQHFIKNTLINCRTGFTPEVPDDHGNGYRWVERRFFQSSYVGFEWYDTGQRHILKSTHFKNCGNPDRDAYIWRALTHSDRFVPENMQASSETSYENCDMSMIYGVTTSVDQRETISRKIVAWTDVDGSAFLRGKPTIIGDSKISNWWFVDGDRCDEFPVGWVGCDVNARFGNRRAIASIFVKLGEHDQDASNEIICSNGSGKPCETIGTVSHFGTDFSMSLKPQGKLTGYANGLGWLFDWDKGTPARLEISNFQVAEGDFLMIVLPFRAGTTFTIVFDGPSWCWRCRHEFQKASSLAEVKDGPGDLYFFDSDAELLFFKILGQTPNRRPIIPNPNLASTAFTRDGISIPSSSGQLWIEVVADCTRNSNDNRYCRRPSSASGGRNNACQLFGGAENEFLHAFDECITLSDLEDDKECSPMSVPDENAPFELFDFTRDYQSFDIVIPKKYYLFFGMYVEERTKLLSGKNWPCGRFALKKGGSGKAKFIKATKNFSVRKKRGIGGKGSGETFVLSTENSLLHVYFKKGDGTLEFISQASLSNCPYPFTMSAYRARRFGDFPLEICHES